MLWGLGIVLCRWCGGGPWLGGLSLVGIGPCYSLRDGVSRSSWLSIQKKIQPIPC